MPLEDAEQTATNTDFGLSADEQAAFDQMRSAAPPTGEPGHVEASAEPEPSEAAPEVITEPAEPVAAAAEPGDDADADDEADDDGAGPAAEEGAVDAQGRVYVDGEWTARRIARSKYISAKKEAMASRTALATERAEKAKLAENQARLDERLRLINEALTPPANAAQQQKDEDPEPDPESDIFGHNAWLKRQLVKTNATIAEMQSGRQAELSEQQLASSYMDDAQRFSEAEPNFGPAYNYLMQVRTAQLANFHFGKDLTDPNCPPLTVQEVAKIKSEVSREEKALVGNALKSGKSPAAAVFAMARMTGFRPQAAPAETPAVVAPAAPAAPANGAAPAAAPTNGAKPSVRAEIDRIKSGQEASMSLSHGGGAPAPTFDARRLADMSPEDFEVALESIGRSGLRRLMGGA